MMKKILLLGLLIPSISFATFLGNPQKVVHGGTGDNAFPSSGQIAIGNGSSIYAPVSMSGGATITSGGVVTLTNASVTGSVLTGYVSGAGTVAATDSILQAIQKLNGNIALEIPSALPSGQILVGSVANVATPVTMSGDATIVASGALTLASTAVTPGSYTSANITVDAKGRISAATSGTVYQTPISTNSGTAHQFFNSFTAPNTFGGAQPAFTDISGTATVAQTTVANQAQSTCATSATLDWSTGNHFTMLLTNSDTCAVTFSNAVSGQTIVIDYTQPSSTGSALVSYVTTVKWPGGTVPTITTGANATDTCTFVYNGTNYRGSCLQNFQ